MTVTPAQLGARALRKLGVAIVADVDRQTAGATITQDEIAVRALRNVGVNPAGVTTGLGSGQTSSYASVGLAALIKLAVIAPDETPSTLDQVNASARALEVHDQLVAMDYVRWLPAAIPNEAVPWYTVMTAQLLAPGYGKPADIAVFEAAEAAIRMQTLSGPTGQDIAKQKIVSVHEELNLSGLVTWTPDTIPAAYGESYVAMVTALLSRTYKPDENANKAYAGAMANVRRLAMGGPAGQALAVQKVLAVHYNLDARGLTRWTIYDLPDYAEEIYVFKAAVLLAPEVEMQAPPSWDMQAERSLYQITTLPSAGRPVQTDYF